MVLDWVGTLPANSFQLQRATTVSSGINFVSSGGLGSGNTNFGGAGANGVNGRVEFTFAATPDGVTNTNSFFIAGTAPNITSLRIFRKIDETNNGGVLPTWFPDFLTAVRALNPRVLRFMGNILNAGNESKICNPQYQYRTPTSAISYASNRYITSRLLTSSCSYNTSTGVYTCGSYSDMPTNWTDKEVFQVNIPTTNSGQNLTVTGAANNGSGLIRLAMADTSSLSTNQIVNFSGYNGSSVVGYGAWTITVIDATHIDLATSYPAGNPSVFATSFSQNGLITTATINVGSRSGNKLLVAPGVFSLPSSAASGFNIAAIAVGIGTCVYDALLDVVFYSPGGLYTGLSPDLCVDLCNTIHKDLWLNVPSLIDNASVTQISSMIQSTLRGGLNCYLEYSNEPWNSAFFQLSYFAKCGEAVGIGAAARSTSQYYSWTGLRSVQIFKAMASSWWRTASQFNGVINVQAAAGVGSNTDLYELQGNLLTTSGNALMSAYTGGLSYNVAPNRPVDYTRVVSYAPYFGLNYNTAGISTAATQYASGSTATALATMTSTMVADYTSNLAPNVYAQYETILANYDGGSGGSRPAGYAPLMVICYEGGPTILSATVSQYTGLGLTSNATVTFNVGTTPGGISWPGHTLVNGNKVNFSGGTLPTNITSGQDYFVMNANQGAGTFDVCLSYYNQSAIVPAGSPSGTTTAVGSTTSFDNLFEAWKASADASTTMQSYITNFLTPASYPHSQMMGFLQLAGFSYGLASGTTNNPNRWSLMPGNIYFTPYYLMFNGVAHANGL
jgi:hypothetical protein